MTGPVYSRPDPFALEQGLSAPISGAATRQAPDVTLASLGEGLLEIVRAAAVSRGVALPARQSVYMAPIPADCEQVAVLFTGWNPEPAPDGGTIVCDSFRWSAGYSVIITRCTPATVNPRSKAPPSTDQMIAAARLASDDAEVCLEVVSRLTEIGANLSIVTNAPSGNLQTVELNVQLLSNVGL